MMEATPCPRSRQVASCFVIHVHRIWLVSHDYVSEICTLLGVDSRVNPGFRSDLAFRVGVRDTVWTYCICRS